MLPLSGILVVSMEQAVAAPFCSNRLLMAGARVIKIERSDGGDFARRYDSAGKGDSSYFIWLNQGKESISLNLKDNKDKEVFLDIITKADIFIQNFAPNTMKKLGLERKKLKNVNPRLIICDISGYGNSPLLAGKKSYDLLIQAESGLISISGSPEGVGRIGVSICDIGAGMAAHSSILESLLLKERYGQIEDVKISLFDVAADWMTVPFIQSQYQKKAPLRIGLKHPSIAPYGAFLNSDNKTIIISIQNEFEWLRFCENVLEKSSLSKNPKFINNNLRVRNRELLDKTIQNIFSKMPDFTLTKKLEKASIAYGRLNSVEDLAQHLALKKIDVYNSESKKLSIPSPPLYWNTTKKKAPRFNEHGEAIRKEFSGQIR